MIVISLGGSIIVPNKVDYKFLSEFKKLILMYSKKNKIVIVTGGGDTCRKYLKALESEKFSENIYSLIGIATTKLNARVVAGATTKKKTLTRIHAATNLYCFKKNRVMVYLPDLQSSNFDCVNSS